MKLHCKKVEKEFLTFPAHLTSQCVARKPVNGSKNRVIGLSLEFSLNGTGIH